MDTLFHGAEIHRQSLSFSLSLFSLVDRSIGYQSSYQGVRHQTNQISNQQWKSWFDTPPICLYGEPLSAPLQGFDGSGGRRRLVVLIEVPCSGVCPRQSDTQRRSSDRFLTALRSKTPTSRPRTSCSRPTTTNCKARSCSRHSRHL